MANVVEVIFRGVDQISRNTTEINRSLQTMNRLAVRAGGALAAAFSVREIGRAVDTMILVENRIRLVTESVEELNAIQEELFRVAQDTRSAFAPTVELYARVARSTKDLGITQQEIIDLTRTVNQTIQISGATAQEASAGVIQFAQALASGELRGEELRSVMEQLSGLSLVLARGLGVGIGELRTMAEAGELTASRIIAVLRDEAPQVAQEFAQITPTIEGAFQNVQNSLTVFVAGLGEASGATEGLVALLQTTSGLIDDFAEAVLGTLDPTDEMNVHIQQLATVAIIAGAALQQMLNVATFLPKLFAAGSKELGGFAAALSFLAKGDLDAAAEASRQAQIDASQSTHATLDDFLADSAATVQSFMDRLDEIWDATRREIEGKSIDLSASRGEARGLGDEIENSKKLLNELAKIEFELATFDMNAVAVELYKLQLLGATDAQLEMARGSLNLIQVLENERERFDELQKAAKAVFEQTRTPLEILQSEIRQLNVLLQEGHIDWTTYSRAIEQAQEEFDEAVAAADEWGQQMEAIADEAARSMQRAFSDFLFDPFQEGLDGMVVGFLNAIRRMLADQAAVKFFELLFGKGDEGGLLAKIFGGGSDSDPFSTAPPGGGPPRAHGGFTIPGLMHPVNEREPEFLLTRGRSEVVPLSKLAASGAGGGARVFSPTTTFQLMTAPMSRDELEQFSEAREDMLFARFKRMLRDDGID